MGENSSGPPNPREARYREMPLQWSGTPVTVFLIAVCLLVAVVSRVGSDPRPVYGLYFGKTNYQIEQQRLDGVPESQRLADAGTWGKIKKGEVWRVVTPAFMHFGALHLVFNLMWLWTLGRPLELLLGRFRYVGLVVVIAVVSNVVQAVMAGVHFGGMSGVVYGLFGFIVVHAKIKPAGGLYLNPRTVQFMLIWLVVCFTGFVGPIANWAHTFGLLSGGALGAVVGLRGGGWKTMKRRQEFRRALSQSAGALHECAVCSRTERDDPDLEFRVGEDGEEYCVEHLPGGD